MKGVAGMPATPFLHVPTIHWAVGAWCAALTAWSTRDSFAHLAGMSSWFGPAMK